MRKFLWPILILGILCVLIGCVDNAVIEGENGIRIKAGEWSGMDDEGTYLIHFNITDGSNVALLYYSFPCGEKSTTVFPAEPIKIEISDSAFEMQVDQTKLTGKFIDRTHAEGTWEVFAHQNIYFDQVCPPAKGSWKGSPN